MIHFDFSVNKKQWQAVAAVVMDKATIRTEEKLKTLIENIKTKALDEQQKNLFNIIKGNFEISKQQIAELRKEIHKLRQSTEHAENVLEDRVARVEENSRNREPYTGNV